MPELMQPNIVGNFLSSYQNAQQQKQAEADAAFNKERTMRADQRQEQQFSQQMDLGKLQMAMQRGKAMADIIGSVREGDAQGFEQAKQRAVQELGLPPESVANLTIADLPRLRMQSGQAMAELDLQLKRAQIEAQRANATQSYAAADAARRAGKEFEGRPKPLPQGPQRQENTWIEQTQVAANNASDVSAYINKIDAGEFDPGLLKNKYDEAKSFFGSVDPNDVNAINYNNFISDMRRLQNESLRLNTGPQTDKDAERAWAELFQNINDKTIVRARLSKIAEYNKRAAKQKAALIQNQRKNFFGPEADAPDWGAFGVDPSILGQAAPAAPAAGGGAPPPKGPVKLKFNPATGKAE